MSIASIMRTTMTIDFIERLFHIAPDGGTGFLELSILVALLLVPVTVRAVRRHRRMQ
jgi:hypothetical protein